MLRLSQVVWVVPSRKYYGEHKTLIVVWTGYCHSSCVQNYRSSRILRTSFWSPRSIFTSYYPSHRLMNRNDNASLRRCCHVRSSHSSMFCWTATRLSSIVHSSQNNSYTRSLASVQSGEESENIETQCGCVGLSAIPLAFVAGAGKGWVNVIGVGRHDCA
jgi:hypothetical protein